MILLFYRLHRHERGQVGLFLVFSMVWIFAIIVLVWNTGRVTAAKVRMQTAADSAAYGAAVITSRSTNIAAGTNTLILRNASAEVLAAASVLTAAHINANWVKYSETLCDGIPPCAAIVYAYLLVSEGPAAWDALFPAITVAGRELWTRSLHRQIIAIHAFQKEMVAECPERVEALRQSLQQQMACRVVYSTIAPPPAGIRSPDIPNDVTRIYPPLKIPSFAQAASITATVFWKRVRDDRQGIEDALEPVVHGEGQEVWRLWTNTMTAVVALASLQRHFMVLSTQDWLSERALLEEARDQERRRRFSLIAAASSSGGAHGLLIPSQYGRGVNRPDTVAAVAQAETANGLDRRSITAIEAAAAAADGDYTYVLRPWRVWTRRGWHWQPRLSARDAVAEYADEDHGLRSFFDDLGISVDDLRDR